MRMFESRGMMNAIRAAFTVAMAMSISLSASAKVKVTIDHNARADANAGFKFKQVPSPARDDAGASAKVTLVLGERDRGSAELNALTDGVLPVDEDDPHSNFFFRAGSS